MNSYYNSIVGANIRYERRLRDMTIEELADILGMAPGFLGLIERGQRGTTIHNLIKIAEFFSITVDTLLTRKMCILGEDDGKTPVQKKRLAAESLLQTLNEYELDYIIICIKGFLKLKSIPGEFEF